MNNLWEKLNQESELKGNWLQEKTSEEIGEALDGEGGILQMIWDIDNDKVRNVLEHNLKLNITTPEEIKKEIAIYYNQVEPKLRDEQLEELFNRLVTGRNLLPSSILREFQNRGKITAEENSEVRKLMEISLDHWVNPSSVIRDTSIYKDLVAVKDSEEKELILRYLNNWCSAIWTKDEYEYYLCIKNYNYKSNDLKKFIISLIIEENVYPSDILRIFELFQDSTECWEDTKKLIRSKIESEW